MSPKQVMSIVIIVEVGLMYSIGYTFYNSDWEKFPYIWKLRKFQDVPIYSLFCQC